MKTIAINKLLPHVRQLVLQEAARGQKTIPLTWLALQVTPAAARFETRGRMSGWSPKKLRGHVQQCLSILAHERLLYSRTAPEGCVQPYEHGERDKRFLIRVSQEQAARLVRSQPTDTRLRLEDAAQRMDSLQPRGIAADGAQTHAASPASTGPE